MKISNKFLFYYFSTLTLISILVAEVVSQFMRKHLAVKPDRHQAVFLQSAEFVSSAQLITSKAVKDLFVNLKFTN